MVGSLTRPEFNATYVTADGEVTTLEALQLTPGVQYTFALQAYNGVPRASGTSCGVVNADGWGALSNMSDAFTPLPTPPETPEPVLLAEAQGKQMKIAWTPPYENGKPITNYTLLTNATECGALTTYTTLPPSLEQCGFVTDLTSATEVLLASPT